MISRSGIYWNKYLELNENRNVYDPDFDQKNSEYMTVVIEIMKTDEFYRT